nr:tyrosine-type recombinase/integrase [uncultured Desulfobacter sp.]
MLVKLPNGSRKSKIVPTLEFAKKLEAKFKTESIESQVFDIHKVPMLYDVWGQYLKWAKINKRSWENDEYRWRVHVAPVLKNCPMDQITPLDIEGVLGRMQGHNNKMKRPYAPQTVKHVYILLTRVYNWAIRREVYTGQNPCTKVSPPKFDNRISKPLKRSDMERLLDVLDNWENQRGAFVVKFALYTGKRRGEILSLRWDDIDFEHRLMTFRATNTKSGKGQTLPIGAKAFEVISDARRNKFCDYVFPSQKGPYKPGGFSSVWKNIRTRAGVTIRFHDLRHTYASYLASSGKVDIYTLKELLGHSTLEMTQRYAHLINGALRKAACVADDVF